MNSRVKKQNSFSRCNHKGDLERKRKQLWFLLRYTHKQKFISMYSRQQKRHQLMPYTQHRMIKLKSQDGFHVFQHFHKMTPFPLYTNPRRYTHQFISFFYMKKMCFFFGVVLRPSNCLSRWSIGQIAIHQKTYRPCNVVLFGSLIDMIGARVVYTLAHRHMKIGKGNSIQVLSIIKREAPTFPTDSAFVVNVTYWLREFRMYKHSRQHKKTERGFN